jgi:Flp pilus assembly protein protease CpaA
MMAITPTLVERAIVALVLLVATVTDIRRRQVPLWLSLGFIASGLVVAALRGPDGLVTSLVGLAVGTLPVLPFVLLGGFGGADLLLLGAIGAWEGWHFVLLAECWTALVGHAAIDWGSASTEAEPPSRRARARRRRSRRLPSHTKGVGA